MKKTVFVLCVLLISASASFAGTIGNGSLKGNYSFQLANAHYDSWYAQITCYDQQGNPYTVSGGGSSVDNQTVLGVVTFNAKGGVTGTYTQYGQFDQNELNATVQLSCTPGQGNNGYAVYDPASTGTFTGTYSVQPNGTGGMVLNLSSGETVSFVIELAGTAAVRSTVFMTQYDSNYRVEISGTAILQ